MNERKRKNKMRYVFIALSLLGFFWFVNQYPAFFGTVAYTIPVGAGIAVTYAMIGFLLVGIAGLMKLSFGKH